MGWIFLPLMLQLRIREQELGAAGANVKSFSWHNVGFEAGVELPVALPTAWHSDVYRGLEWIGVFVRQRHLERQQVVAIGTEIFARALFHADDANPWCGIWRNGCSWDRGKGWGSGSRQDRSFEVG